MARKKMPLSQLKKTLRTAGRLGKLGFHSIKIFLKIILLSLIGLIAAGFLYFSSVDLNTHIPYIEKQLSNLLSRSVKIKGSVDLDIKKFRPVIDVNKLYIASADWDSKNKFISADRAFLSLDFFSLFTGNFRLDEIYLRRAKINLRESKKGQKNWQLISDKADKDNTPEKSDTKEEKNDSPKEIPKKEEKEQESFSLTFSVRSIVLDGIHISYKSPTNKLAYDIEHFSVQTKSVKDKINIQTKLTYKGKIYNGTIQTLSLESLFNPQTAIPINLSLSSGETYLKLNGVIGNPTTESASEGNFEFSGKNIKKTLKPFGIDFPHLRETKIAGNVFFTKDFINLSKINGTVGKSNFKIEASVLLNSSKRPRIQGKISSSLFDIRNTFVSSGISTNKTPAYIKEKRDPKAFIGVKFPLAIFKKFDTDLSIEIKKLKPMKTMSVENIKLNATLVNGKFTLANSHAYYAGGKVKFSATGAIGNTLSAEASVDGENVSVGEIVRMSGGGNLFEENTSLANVKIYLKGQGNTLSKLMGSLNGTGKVYTQKKTKGYGITTYFLGQDLISALVDQFSEKGKDLEINCVAGHIRIKNGVAYSNKGIALESDKINAVIEGHVDLGKEYTKVSLISKPSEYIGNST